MNKHIIVAGAPRSGKTTISRELSSFCSCVHYRLDSIKRAVFEVFCPDNKDWHFASQMTVKIIKKLVDDNNQESVRKEWFVFDTPHIYPEDVKDLSKDEYIIVFVGYTDVDVEEKVDTILKYDAKTCWTQKLTRERLKELVTGNVSFSKEIEAQCKKYGIPYFDVSHNQINVLNDVKNYIKQNI